MGTRLRTGIAVTVATVASLAGLTALPASADPIPSNCTLTKIDDQTKKLTCTRMPAGRRWALSMDCVGFTWEGTVYGNIVTRNGTSTASCRGIAPYTAGPRIIYYS